MKEAIRKGHRSNYLLNVFCFFVPLMIALKPLVMVKGPSAPEVLESPRLNWYPYVIFSDWRLVIVETAVAVIAAILFLKPTSLVTKAAAASVLWGSVFNMLILGATLVYIMFIMP